MAAVKKTSPENARGLRENEKKWTKPLLAAGWSLIPSVILERQQALGLDPVDMNILLHIVRRWWYADKLPYPSKREIAECMGIDESTVRRHIKAMEADGLIRRIERYVKDQGQKSNFYDLTGLITSVQPYAEEAVKRRAARNREDDETRTRKRLKLVEPTSDE
jgi:DNA-binding MarR family transcriptional regulator